MNKRVQIFMRRNIIILKAVWIPKGHSTDDAIHVHLVDQIYESFENDNYRSEYS